MLPPTSYDKPSLITKGGRYWEPPATLWTSISEVYGVQFCREEYFKAWAWLEANDRRRKTERGMPRFLNNWMSRAAKEQVKRPDDSWAISKQAPFSEEEALAIRARIDESRRTGRDVNELEYNARGKA